MNNSAIQRPQNEDNAERNSSNGSHNLSHSDPAVNGGAKLSIRSAMPEDVVYSRNNEEGIRTLLGGPNPHEYSESLATPNKVSQPDCGVKDVEHEVALNSYQKVVEMNGEYAIIGHVK
jgi:hypothetical protein